MQQNGKINKDSDIVHPEGYSYVSLKLLLRCRLRCLINHMSVLLPFAILLPVKTFCDLSVKVSMGCKGCKYVHFDVH